jgi:hypothetical protein
LNLDIAELPILDDSYCDWSTTFSNCSLASTQCKTCFYPNEKLEKYPWFTKSLLGSENILTGSFDLLSTALLDLREFPASASLTELVWEINDGWTDENSSEATFAVFVDQLRTMPILQRLKFTGDVLLTGSITKHNSLHYTSEVLNRALEKLLVHPTLREVVLQGTLVVDYRSPAEEQEQGDYERRMQVCDQLQDVVRNFGQKRLAGDSKLRFFLCDLAFLLFERDIDVDSFSFDSDNSFDPRPRRETHFRLFKAATCHLLF